MLRLCNNNNINITLRALRTKRCIMFRTGALVTILTATLAQVNANFMESCGSFELIEGHFLRLNCRNPRHFGIGDWTKESFIELGECYSNKDGKLSLDKGYGPPSYFYL